MHSHLIALLIWCFLLSVGYKLISIILSVEDCCERSPTLAISVKGVTIKCYTFFKYLGSIETRNFD